MSSDLATIHRRLVLLHWLNVPLVIATLGVGAYRTWGIRTAISNRMDIVVITAGAKAVAFLLYILATTHISSLKRFYSYTTILIMSIIDSVLWVAALGLTAYGMVQIPATGTRNILNWILVVLLAVTILVSLPVVYFAFRQRKMNKRGDISSDQWELHGSTDDRSKA